MRFDPDHRAGHGSGHLSGDLPGSGAFRTFLEAMAQDEDTARGGVAVYESLGPAGRNAWIEQVEQSGRGAGAPIGRALLSLLGVETDAIRQRRLLACAAEPPFALRREGEAGACWQLVRPLGCELACIATVQLSREGRVLSAHYVPLAPLALEGFEGVALGEAVNALAHAIVHDPEPLRPVLLPFVELFSSTVRAVEAAA